jgi:KDO2-lipid IV(A) lauroyltransferase
MGLLIQLLLAPFALLPRPIAMALGRSTGTLVGSVLRYRRREVLAALHRAFPERSEREIRGLAAGTYRHLGTTFAEVARLSARGLAETRPFLRVVQDEHHACLVSQSKGALLLMGHVGNWELTAGVCATLPHTVHAIVKPLKPDALQDFMVRVRALLGLRLLNFRNSFGEALRALRRGEIIAVILDQNQRRSLGVFVDFLGEQACTSPGLAILSSLSGAPVFPIFTERGADGVNEIRVLPPIDAPPDRQRETLQRYTQAYTRALEGIIRRNPEQWTWIHHRWRTRPEQALQSTPIAR